MTLKNAVAVCLIALFSATLVVLIARSLDSQAASRLEPQLTKIVEELQAIRKQGGIRTSPSTDARTGALDDGLIVYYFHGNTRCPTCQAIESQARETVQSDFAEPLGGGRMVWEILNYEDASAGSLAKKFEIQMPVVVLAKMKAGEIVDWKRLDKVWALVGNKADFAGYVRDEIKGMLGDKPDNLPKQETGKVKASSSMPPSGNLPLPAPTPDLPLPK